MIKGVWKTLQHGDSCFKYLISPLTKYLRRKVILSLSLAVFIPAFYGASSACASLSPALIEEIRSEWHLKNIPAETKKAGKTESMLFSYAQTLWALESLDNTDEPHTYLTDFWIDLWIERQIGKVGDIKDSLNDNNILLRLINRPLQEKIEKAATRFFKLKTIAGFINYLSEPRGDERFQVKEKLAIARQKLVKAVDEGFSKVARSPEKWQVLQGTMRVDLEKKMEENVGKINAAGAELRDMRWSLLKSIDPMLGRAINTCIIDYNDSADAKIDLLVAAFRPNTTAKKVLRGKALPTYLSAQIRYVRCMSELALNPMVKGNEENQYLINSMLSIREFLQASDTLLSGGKDALATEALIDLSRAYLASLRWNKRGAEEWSSIQKKIDNLTAREQELMRHPLKNDIINENGKGVLKDVLADLQRDFRRWNFYLRMSGVKTSREISLVSDGAMHLWRAAMIKGERGGGLYCYRDNCAIKALLEYERAIEAEPLDWRGWLHLARIQVETGGPIASAAETYDKALSLIERCENNVNAICPDITSDNYEKIRLEAAGLHLMLAHYKRAAELYAAALKQEKKEGPAQWGAVARYGAEDFDAARTQYRATAGEPEKFEKSGALEVMLRSGFIRLSEAAEKEGRLWDTYSHEQNIARLEAQGDILQRPKPHTTERLLSLYRRLTWRRHTWRGHDGTEISPDMSPYGRSHAEAAYKLARRGKFYKARRNFRLALATDPWWVYGAVELAYVNYELIGLCDAIPAAERALELMKQGTLEPVSILNIEIPLRDRLARWREQKEYADQHGTGYMAGYCDPDPDLPNRVIISPDREILSAPK